MVWHKVRIEFDCVRCGKAVKPGRKLGLYQGRVYCYRCGHNIELEDGYRFVAKADRQALAHMRSI